MNMNKSQPIGLNKNNQLSHRILIFAGAFLFFPLGIFGLHRYTSIEKVWAILLCIALSMLLLGVALENGAFVGFLLANIALVLVISGFVYDPSLEKKNVRFALFFFVLPRASIAALFIFQIYIIAYGISRKKSEEIFMILLDISATGVTRLWLLNCSIVLAFLVTMIYAFQIKAFFNKTDELHS